MDFYDALRHAAAATDTPLTRIGPALGKSLNYVNNGMARQSDPTCANAAAMLNVCGWQLVAMPAESVPGDALVIDPVKNAKPKKQQSKQ